jgi:hypothetical protein
MEIFKPLLGTPLIEGVVMLPDSLTSLTVMVTVCESLGASKSGVDENERVPEPLIEKSAASFPVSEYVRVVPASGSVALSE